MPHILELDERYGRLNIEIDISTFSYYGSTEGYYDYRRDASIAFRLANPSQSEKVVEELRNKLKFNVNKEEYVTLRTKFESYEKDTRPAIWIRIPSGMTGIANPMSFSFKYIHPEDMHSDEHDPERCEDAKCIICHGE